MATTTPTDFDIRVLVNDTADSFSKEFGVRVGGAAREELITRALPYRETVANELADGTITIEFLQDTLLAVLKNARRIMLDGDALEVGVEEVVASMEEECPYLFWC